MKQPNKRETFELQIKPFNHCSPQSLTYVPTRLLAPPDTWVESHLQ